MARARCDGVHFSSTASQNPNRSFAHVTHVTHVFFLAEALRNGPMGQLVFVCLRIHCMK